jgi:hypothetical protein
VDVTDPTSNDATAQQFRQVDLTSAAFGAAESLAYPGMCVVLDGDKPAACACADLALKVRRGPVPPHAVRSDQLAMCCALGPLHGTPRGSGNADAACAVVQVKGGVPLAETAPAMTPVMAPDVQPVPAPIPALVDPPTAPSEPTLAEPLPTPVAPPPVAPPPVETPTPAVAAPVADLPPTAPVSAALEPLGPSPPAAAFVDQGPTVSRRRLLDLVRPGRRVLKHSCPDVANLVAWEAAGFSYARVSAPKPALLPDAEALVAAVTGAGGAALAQTVLGAPAQPAQLGDASTYNQARVCEWRGVLCSHDGTGIVQIIAQGSGASAVAGPLLSSIPSLQALALRGTAGETAVAITAGIGSKVSGLRCVSV